MEHVQPHGVGSAQQHVDSQIELQTIQEVGSGQIALDDVVLAVLEVVQLSGEEDASPLAVGLRLDDVGPALPLGFGVEVAPELCVLEGKHPGQGEEVVLLGEVVSEVHQIDS